MTIEQALDAVQSADPRYAWREQDGILVIRPQSAWTDPHHFFNRPVGTVNEIGTNWWPMLWRVRDWIYPGTQSPPPWRLPPTPHAPFDVHVSEGTVLNVLDETVKSAGDMYWCLGYGNGPCTVLRPQPTSTIVWISMRLLENGGAPGSGGSVIHRGLPPPWMGSSGAP